MKTKKPVLEPLALLASALLCCALRLPAQTAPTITTQPTNQTVFGGSNVTFTVAVSGTGPFNYQWQLNGANLPNNIITTVAGNGGPGFSGDGGAATNACLSTPQGVASDAVGNLFIADSSNNRIRKVGTNGIITTVAGNGAITYSGDGGAATNASLGTPTGVALDAFGNLYIADSFNSRIRKVGTNGVISTVAGTNSAGNSGDGGAATSAKLHSPSAVALDTAGDLYIADTINRSIRKVGTNGIITTVAAAVSLRAPNGLAVDSLGNLYIADTIGNRIFEVGTNGIIARAAGNGIAGYSGDGGAATNANLNSPGGIALDTVGNLYIADYHNCVIREVGTNGIITTVAGNGNQAYAGDGGAATNASLSIPAGVALDAVGNLYVADSGNLLVREIHFAGYPTLSLTNLSAINAGSYTVVITNRYGSVTSAVAALTVAYSPSIVVQPGSRAVFPGSNAKLSVIAAGSPPLYFSFYANATNLVQGGTNSTLTVVDFSVNDAGSYTVVVTNAYGSVTSQVATLMVASPPSVTIPPASQTVFTGSNVAFSVAMEGAGPFSYQWQFNGTNLPNAIITTVAGNGTGAYAGNGGSATNASLYSPEGVALDDGDNLYIADTSNHCIRVVAANGIITTAAGNGAAGYSGDGGAAAEASLYSPCGVAVDASGNLYVADTYNQCIREMAITGIISTVAGNGSATYAGDGGAATNAGLNYPSSVAVDAVGNLYIADTSNNCLRVVAANGIITTVAGNGTAGYSGDGGAAASASLADPAGLAVDSFGNLYVADTGNNRIRKVDTNGIITTVAGNGSAAFAGDGGVATNAGMNQPRGLALDAIGNLYVADQYSQRIREVHFAGYPTLSLTNVGASNAGSYTVVVTSPYGRVTSAVATLIVHAPTVITLQPTNQTVLAGSNPMFSVVVTGSGPFGYLWYFAGNELIQSGANSTLTVPSASATNAGDYMVVVTNDYSSVTSQVATLTVLTSPWVVSQPASQSVLAGANATFSVTMADTGPCTCQWQLNGANLSNNIITTVAGNGTSGYAGDGGVATSAELYSPYGVALDTAGDIFIADTLNQRVRKVDIHGIVTTVAGTNSSGYAGDGGAATYARLNSPSGVVLDALGNLYIADAGNSRIRKVDSNGNIATVAGTNIPGYSGDGGAAIYAKLNSPLGVAVDASGNLFIADSSNNRIRKVDTNGVITTVAGTNSAGYSGDGGAAIYAKLYQPPGVALDALGNLYIVDEYNSRIRKVDTNGIITTVAGSGSYRFLGDGGAATNAGFSNPTGVAVDALGDLFIADCNNNRIRRVDANGLISTVAGNGNVYSALGDGGAPTNACLNAPHGVAMDASGNLYIADTGKQRIRKALLDAGNPMFLLSNVNQTNAGSYSVVISNAYGIVTSAVATLTVQAPPVITFQPFNQIAVAGSSPAFAVTVAGSGPFGYLLYFAGTNLVQSGTNSTLALPAVSGNDAGSYTIVVTNAWGSVTSRIAILTVAFPPSVTASPGSQNVLPGTNVSFSVTAGGTGPFSYAWQFNGACFQTNVITTVAGCGSNGFAGDGGAATNAKLNDPASVCLDAAGNLYVADYSNNCIRKVDASGIITTVAGTNSAGYSGDGGAATNAKLNGPDGLALDSVGNLFIIDFNSSRIRKVDTNGMIITVAGNGTFGYSGDGSVATKASLRDPMGVATDAYGNVYIADFENNVIRKVDANGIITTVAGNGLGAGSLGGSFSGDGGAAINAGLYNPTGVALDAAGNLYIADNQNNRIRKVDIHGVITTVAGGGSGGDGGAATNAALRWPFGVAVDAAGNLFFANDSTRIRMVGTNGIITTVAGNLLQGYSGDGGAATNASLHSPGGIALDALGNLYISDSGNSRVREVNLAGYPVLTLTNVSATNVGSYTVVITSPYGSVTSAVAALTVTIPRTAPQIVAGDACFGFVASQFGFNLSGAFGQTIVVDGSTNLVDWTPLCTNTVAGSAVYFCDPGWTNFGWRFYRARLQ